MKGGVWRGTPANPIHSKGTPAPFLVMGINSGATSPIDFLYDPEMDGTGTAVTLPVLSGYYANYVTAVEVNALNVGGGANITKHLSATATLDASAPSVVPGCSTDLTITVTGAATTDTVALGSRAAVTAVTTVSAWVSSANTVTIRWCQFSGTAADPDGAGGTYRVDVWKH